VNLIDTNVFVRYIAEATTETEHRHQEMSSALFTAAESGVARFITTPDVISEVTYVLTNKEFRLSRAEIASNLISLLLLQGCEVADRDELVVTLLSWTTKPRLSFVDTRLLVRAQDPDLTLITFDTDLAKAAGVQRWDRQSRRE